MRFIRGCALLPLLLCACGGGGGGGGGGSTADQQAALTLLETCGLDGLGSFLEVLGISISVVDPNATTLPPFVVMGADQAGGSIQWQLDLGGDPTPEFLGFIQFSNEMGQPAEPPFDLTQFVAGGLATLDQFLVQLDDGWTVTVNVNAPLAPLINFRVVLTYTSGVVSDSTGNGTVQDGTCGTNLIFDGIALADLAGPFPTGEFTSTYGDGASLTGTTTFDGTDTAIIDGVVNGGTATYAFSADLGAGTVTTVP